jgi:hypothetical protein
MSLLSQEWIETIRTRARLDQLAVARHTLDEQVEAYHAGLPSLPERQAGYYHDFFCPQHAVQLRFDPGSPHRHSCPIDGEIFSGEPFDSGWRWSLNDLLSDAVLKLSVRAVLHDDATGSARDRQRAIDILTGYAARYRTIQAAPVGHPNHPGIVTWSGLDESVWIIRMAWAHALVHTSLTIEQDRLVRDELLRPAADHLRRVRWPEIHNVTNWNNAALATLALGLDDRALLAEALGGPLGLAAQLAIGVRPDGLWWEGSLSYHYYTLAALVWTARAVRASGLSFDGDDVIRRMFHAPLALAFPDLTLPAIHDCWYFIGLLEEVGHGIPSAAGFYEIAYGWYGDPEFAWVLRENYARRPRASFEALLDGAETLPAAAAPVFGCSHLTDSGLAVLRTSAPPEQQSYLLLRAGPDGGGHGHPDQLSIQFFARGARLSVDLGTPGYGIALNDTWYRQTASHSTALVNGRSQPAATGRLVRFEVDEAYAVVSGAVEWDRGDYRGVHMRRLILWREYYFVDLFQVECSQPGHIDWIYHGLGDLVTTPSLDGAPAELVGGCGYASIGDVRRIAAAKRSRLDWRVGSVGLRLYLAPMPDAELFVGVAPANPAATKLPIAVRRQWATHATFRSVFVPYQWGDDPPVRGASWSSADDQVHHVTIDAASESEDWWVGDDLTSIRWSGAGSKVR